MKTRCTSAGLGRSRSPYLTTKIRICCDPPSLLLSSVRLPGTGAVCQWLVTTALDGPRSMWDLGRSRTPQTLKGIAGNLSLPSKFLIIFQLFNIKDPLVPLFSRLSQHAALLVRREHCHGAFSARTRSAHHLKRDRWEGMKSSSDLLWLTQQHPCSTPVYTVGDHYTPYRHIFIQCISMRIAKNGNF